MSNRKEEVTQRRQQVFNILKTMGEVSVADVAELMSVSYSIAAGDLADLHIANLATRRRKPLEEQTDNATNPSGFYYKTDLAEFRWGDREHRALRLHEIQASTKAMQRKSAAAAPVKVPKTPAQAVWVSAPAPAPTPKVAEDAVGSLIEKIQDLSYRDVVRLKAAVAALAV